MDVVAPDEQVLLEALGHKIAERPWPELGEIVTIAEDWDGPAVHGADSCLCLRAGDKVAVKHRNADGLLYGTVQGKDTRSGWFGGMGCHATMQVTVPVPLGDSKPLLSVPHEPPSEFSEEGLALDVELYLVRHGIDDKASLALRTLEPALQKEIIRSDLSNCRNPSAVLLSRIDRIRAGGAPAAGVDSSRGGGSMPPPAAGTRPRSRSPAPLRSSAGTRSSPSVEDFILRLRLDERVATELRLLQPEEQQQVITTDLTNARNPSAVVSSRIQTVRTWSVARSAVDEYVARHHIDDVAAHALQSLPVELQQQVMRSDISNSRNPSAVLLSRIRSVEAQAAQAGLGLTTLPAVAQPSVPIRAAMPAPKPAPPGLMSLAPSTSRAVEEYIRTHGLDDKVAQELRSLTPLEQQQVISSNITNARNPSAIVSSRILAVRGQAIPRPVSQTSIQLGMLAQLAQTGAVEAYLARHPVDDAAARALLELPPELQARIIEQDLSNCRNPSAVLLSRCRAAAAAAGLPTR